MLNLVAPIEADEPAAPVAPAKLEKSDLDRRALNRRAMRLWPAVQPYIYDYKGFATGPASLDPSYRPSPNGEKWPGRPRVTELNGPSPWVNADGSGPGSWECRSNGKFGKSVIELVMYLGNTDTKTATNWLRDLLDRMVEIAK